MHIMINYVNLSDVRLHVTYFVKIWQAWQTDLRVYIAREEKEGK